MCGVSKMADRGNTYRFCNCISWLVILALLCTVSRPEVTVITEGHHFMLAYPEMFPRQCQFLMILTPSLPADSSQSYVSVNINQSALNTCSTLLLTTGNPTSVTLREKSPPSNFDDYENNRSNNVIYVDATVGKISVIGRVNCGMARSKNRRAFGEFLAIPVEYWGNRYVVMAPFQLSCGYTITILTANLENSVKIDLKIRKLVTTGYVDITGIHITQNGVWNFQPVPRTEIVAVSTDITGSILESVYPIGVLVGPKNEATLDIALCSFNQGLFMEQLVPTYAWGKSYYINDGGASPSLLYKYDIRVVASMANTIIYLNYKDTFANKTMLFKRIRTLMFPGSSYSCTLEALEGFDIVAADRPIMVLIYTYKSLSGDDGAMMQAIMTKSWPRRVVLKLSSNLSQRFHVLMDTACSSVLTFVTDLSIIEPYNSLDKGKQELEFYFPSYAGQTESQIVVSVSTSVEGCTGISAFSMEDAFNGNDILGASPNFWSIECPYGTHFNMERKVCTSFQKTSTTLSSSSQLTTAAVFTENTSSSPINEFSSQSTNDTLENSSDFLSESTSEPPTTAAFIECSLSNTNNCQENTGGFNNVSIPDLSSNITDVSRLITIDLSNVTIASVNTRFETGVDTTLSDNLVADDASWTSETNSPKTWTSEIKTSERSSTSETNSHETSSTPETNSHETSSTPETNSHETSSTPETNSHETSTTSETNSHETSSTSETNSHETSSISETNSHETYSTAETNSHETTSTPETNSHDTSSTAKTNSHETYSTAETNSHETTSTPETNSHDTSSTAKTNSHETSSTSETNSHEKVSTLETSSPETSSSSETNSHETFSTSETKEPETSSASETKEPETASTSETKAPETSSTSATNSHKTSSTSERKEPETSSTSETKEPETSSTSEIMEPETSSTSETNSHETSSMSETNEPDTSSTSETKELETSSTSEINSHERSSTSETKEPEISSTSETKEPEISSTSETKEPETSSPSEIMEPETSSTSETKEPKTPSPSETKEPETSSTSETKESETSSTSETKEPETLSTSETKGPETASISETKGSVIIWTSETKVHETSTSETEAHETSSISETKDAETSSTSETKVLEIIWTSKTKKPETSWTLETRKHEISWTSATRKHETLGTSEKSKHETSWVLASSRKPETSRTSSTKPPSDSTSPLQTIKLTTQFKQQTTVSFTKKSHESHSTVAPSSEQTMLHITNSYTTSPPAGNKSMWTLLLTFDSVVTKLRTEDGRSNLTGNTTMRRVSSTVTIPYGLIIPTYVGTDLATATPKNDKQSTKECPCFCQSRNNKTKLLEKHAVEDPKDYVPNLSRIKRLYTSAPDWRPQSLTIGVFAIVAVMCCSLLLIMAPTTVNLRNQRKNTKPTRRFY